jgi:hypothetical protein
MDYIISPSTSLYQITDKTSFWKWQIEKMQNTNPDLEI